MPSPAGAATRSFGRGLRRRAVPVPSPAAGTAVTRIGLEVLLIVLLVVVNGVFAMSEIAVVSSRRARLQQRADEGDTGARRALELADHPNRFLSTVQIGITAVGIFAGAYGGATLARHLVAPLTRVPTLAPYAEEIALGLVVLVITYLSLVVGELVPKRIGMTHPERIAAAVAGPMHLLSLVASPLVRLLSVSTEGLLRLLRIRRPVEPPVTEEEISALMEQGTEAGVFEEEEQEMVERVFWLADQRVGALMTPRHRIVWMDAAVPPEQGLERVVERRLSRFLVCDGALDRVQGMVEVKDLWAAQLRGEAVPLAGLLRPPLFVPESTRALRLLESFRDTGVHMAVVVDEYGGVAGLVTLNDVLQEVGGTPEADDPATVEREDGSLLVDGGYSVEDLRERLGLEERRAEDRGDYHSVGGFVVTRLGRIPRAGDHFEADGFRWEVVDMDGNRVDKVLVAALAPPDGEDAGE